MSSAGKRTARFLLAAACDSYVSCVHCVACLVCVALDWNAALRAIITLQTVWSEIGWRCRSWNKIRC